ADPGTDRHQDPLNLWRREATAVQLGLATVGEPDREQVPDGAELLSGPGGDPLQRLAGDSGADQIRGGGEQAADGRPRGGAAPRAVRLQVRGRGEILAGEPVAPDDAVAALGRAEGG